jgi:hypothetical protein
MTPKRSSDEEPKSVPWVRIIVASAIGVGVVYVLFWWLARPTDIAGYGSLGDALAPLSVLGSTIGLVAALVSVAYQRRELALQRTELALQREEMQKSQAELARTAKAQEDLAKSQADLARQQQAMVGESTASRLALHGLTSSLLHAAVAQLEANKLLNRNALSYAKLGDTFDANIASLRAYSKEQDTVYEQLRDLVSKGQA